MLEVIIVTQTLKTSFFDVGVRFISYRHCMGEVKARSYGITNCRDCKEECNQQLKVKVNNASKFMFRYYPNYRFLGQNKPK